VIIVIYKKYLIKERITKMSETDYGCYCKKCFLKKHKLSKKNINRIVFTPYVEECDGCGKVEKLVDYVEDEDNEW
jgi:hypothetical protein